MLVFTKIAKSYIEDYLEVVKVKKLRVERGINLLKVNR